MLSCRDVTDRASAYLDGDLGWRARLCLRAHLAICRNCRRYLGQLRTTITILRRLPSALPRGEVDRIFVLFSAAMGDPQPKNDAPL
jgi:anti-sigma factor RsiW